MIKKLIENTFLIDLSSPSQSREIVDGRKIYAKLIRDIDKLTFQEIGDSIKRKPSSITRMCQEAEILINSNCKFREKYNYIKNKINVEPKGNFYGVLIPPSIWLKNDLTSNEKLVLATLGKVNRKLLDVSDEDYVKILVKLDDMDLI